ncbi:MAG: hypothetical protein V7724_14480 [Sediminicola sp.]
MQKIAFLIVSLMMGIITDMDHYTLGDNAISERAYVDMYKGCRARDINQDVQIGLSF